MARDQGELHVPYNSLLQQHSSYDFQIHYKRSFFSLILSQAEETRLKELDIL